MLIGIIWTLMTAAAILYSCASGTSAAVGEAALKGAEEAVGLCISIGGIICLWCALLELMSECGILNAMSRLLMPVLRFLFPEAARHRDISESMSANVSANLLGLGNAATPMGIRTVQGMARLCPEGTASDELCRFVVLNTASIQLLPVTTAAIRAAEGAAVPFDILPAVWISSAFSVSVGLLLSWAFARL